MMDRQRFEELAGAISSGEATPQECAELELALAQDLALAREWKEIQRVDAALRAAVPPAAAPMPPGVLARLHAARSEALSERMAAEARAGGAGNVVEFQPDAPAARRAFPSGAWLALAACLAALLGIAGFWMARPRPAAVSPSAVLSPRGEIGVTRPTLVWEAKPDQRYDVWILPSQGSYVDAPALFTAKGVRPPLDFSELQPGPSVTEQSRPTTRLDPGADYRVLVCIADAGRIAGVAIPFRTAPDATKDLPPPSLDAVRALATRSLPSDALMLLTQLPPAERNRPETQALEKELRSRLSKAAAPSAAPAP